MSFAGLPLRILIAALLPIGAPAAILTVNTVEDQLDSPAGAELSLREAERDAAAGDTIVFAPALAGQTIELISGVEIVLSKDLSIDATGLGAAGLTLGGFPSTCRFFHVPAGRTVSISGLTFNGGTGMPGGFGNLLSPFVDHGGAILNQGTLHLADCTFTGNTAAVQGGAIFSTQGALTIDRCRFSGNSTGGNGGAIHVDRGSVSLVRSALSENSSGGTGGALHLDFTSFTGSRSTFWENTSAGSGGAIRSIGSALELSQCTLTANSASSGGGMSILSGSIMVGHCTIVQNAAVSGPGGGIQGSVPSQLCYNSIVADNTAASGNTDISGLVNVVSVATGGNVLLAPLGSYGGPTLTMPPRVGSRAINPTNPYVLPGESPPTTDQRGYPVDGIPDLGAAEGKVVVTTAADELDSLTTNGAGISLREALRDTPAGAAVGFAPALSGQTITLTSGTEITLAKIVTVDAGTLAGGVTIDGGPGANRLFSVSPGTAVSLVGLSLTGGNGGGASDGGAVFNGGELTLRDCSLIGNTANTQRGGAVFNQGTLNIEDCVLTTNTAGLGGAVFSLSGNVTVSGSDFSENSSNAGGAIHHASGPLVVNGSRFTGNSAGSGGAVHLLSGSLSVDGSSFSGNTATQAGGAIQTPAATLGITRCLFSGNSSLNGGAIGAGSGALNLSRSTFAGNTATHRGGAIHGSSGALSLSLCTLTQNSADQGGAIHGGAALLSANRCTITGNSATTAGGIHVPGGSFSVVNSILAANTGSAGTENYLGTLAGGSTNFTGGDPQLHPLGEYGGLTPTMPPLPVSPAVNATAGSTSPTDQRGFPSAGKADLGAAESSTLVTALADESDANASSGTGISLREAVRDTPPGASIVFSTGLSGQTLTLTSAAEIVISRDVVIDAGNLAAGLTIDGGTGDNRIFSLPADRSLTLIGLTLTGGNGLGATGSGSGAAIYSMGSLSLTRCTVTANSCGGSGAIASMSGSLAIDQCTIAGNSAVSRGGGVYCGPVASSITRSTFSGNSSQRGGAVNCQSGTPLIQDCVFTGNTASNQGGALVFIGATATIERCSLSGNTGPTGGALYNSSGANTSLRRSTFDANSAVAGGAVFTNSLLSVQNCTLTGNTAEFGAAITVNSNATTLEHVTISINSATTEGGGILVSSGTCTLTNSIVAANSAGTAGTENLAGTINASGANFTAGDPKLALLGQYGGPTRTMPPAPDSPVVDAGGPTALTLEQRGLARVLGAAADLGAVESGHPITPLLVTTAADENDGAGSGGISLRDAVAFAPEGSTIGFVPGLSGQTITLTTAAEIVLGKSVLIDASGLVGGLVIEGGAAANRLFSVGSGRTVTLRGLTLTGGNGNGSDSSGDGGAILNRGNLTVDRCTLSGNSSGSDRGGAIFNSGSLTVHQSTLSGNGAPEGGAVASEAGNVTIVQSTLSANSATDNGGGISILGGTCTLTHSIVAGNFSNNSTTANIRGTVLAGGSNLTSGNPQLAALGYYGGPMRTMPPLPGSPAIDGAAGSVVSKDQRGISVFGTPDLGAAEGATVVNVVADELDDVSTAGTGVSLREAVRDTPAGSIVVFDPELSGDAISLNRGTEILVSKNLTIDAASLPGGINVYGDGSRVFRIGSGRTVFLRRISLAFGTGIGPAGVAGGGAIYNEGNLSLDTCQVGSNLAPEGADGGAIFSSGPLNLLRSGLAASQASRGGAIFSTGPVTIDQCELSMNFAASDGGAIHCTGPLEIRRSTIASNRAASGAGIHQTAGTLVVERCTISANIADGAAGGVLFSGSGFTLRDSILAGNSAGDGATANLSGAFTGAGSNLTSGDPLLGPLDGYGGPTRTMVLLPGSPARNAAPGSTFTRDQRDLPIIGVPDIGAYEAGTIADFDAWAIESTGSSAYFGDDTDGDGLTAGVEYAIRGDLAADDRALVPTLAPVSGGHAYQFRYRSTARDILYFVQRSSDLGKTDRWRTVYVFDSRTGTGYGYLGASGLIDPVGETITVTDPVTGPRHFWRLLPEYSPN